MCRPHGDLKEGTGTAFVVDIGGTWVVMSAMHCFLKDKKVSGMVQSEIHLQQLQL